MKYMPTDRRPSQRTPDEVIVRDTGMIAGTPLSHSRQFFITRQRFKLSNPNNRGIRRILNAFRYTFAGLRAAWINEEAFRQEIILVILIIPLGIWLGNSGTQKALLIGFYLVIPLTELLNSAIEAVVDRIGKEHHELSGRAKDLGSAAVFLGICTAVTVWLIIVCERFL